MSTPHEKVAGFDEAPVAERDDLEPALTSARKVAADHGVSAYPATLIAKAAISAMGEIPYRDMFFKMQKRNQELEIEVINLKRSTGDE